MQLKEEVSGGNKMEGVWSSVWGQLSLVSSVSYCYLNIRWRED